MSGDIVVMHLLFSVALVTGVAQVASAMTRWPRTFPAERAHRLEISRRLVRKAMKALGGTALADVAGAAIMAAFAPLVSVAMLAAGLFTVAALVALPASTTGRWSGVLPSRTAGRVARARRATVSAAVAAGGSMALGALSWSAFVVAIALLVVSSTLRHWSAAAAAELAELRA